MTMDYGRDWPPPPKPEPSRPPRHRRFTLWQKCAIAIVAYAVIAVLALIAVHVLVAPLDPYKPAASTPPAVTHTKVSSRASTDVARRIRPRPAATRDLPTGVQRAEVTNDDA